MGASYRPGGPGLGAPTVVTMRRAGLYIALAMLLVSGFAAARYLEASGMAERALGPFAAPSGTSGPVPPGREAPFGATSSDLSPGVTSPGSDETVLAGEVLPPIGRDQAYWGIYTPGAPYQEEASRRAFELAGETPAIVMWYQEWADQPPFPAREAASLVERGIVPMVTWEAWDPPGEDPDLAPADVREEADQPDFRLEEVVDGEFDPYLRDYARQVREYGGPVMIRLFHEMNGFWFPWGGTVNQNDPEDVVDAWRHVVDVFDDEGATNVTWVWNPNAESVPDVTENQPDAYWPGDAYVDWVGLSGFNFGTTSEVSEWRAFTEIFTDPLEDVSAYDAPIVIAEFAAPETGGDKSEWITSAFEAIHERFPDVDAAVWFDRQVGTARDFRIDSSEDALSAFLAAVADDRFLPAPSAVRRTEPVPDVTPGSPSPAVRPTG